MGGGSLWWTWRLVGGKGGPFGFCGLAGGRLVAVSSLPTSALLPQPKKLLSILHPSQQQQWDSLAVEAINSIELYNHVRRACEPHGPVHRLLRKTLSALTPFSILCFVVPLDDLRLPPVKPLSGIHYLVRGMGMAFRTTIPTTSYLLRDYCHHLRKDKGDREPQRGRRRSSRETLKAVQWWSSSSPQWRGCGAPSFPGSYPSSTQSNCRVRRSLIDDAVVLIEGEGTSACIAHPRKRCSNAEDRRLSTGTASLPTNSSFIPLDFMGTDSHMNCELRHDRLAFLPLPKHESTVPEANSE
ncbi:hypothetical protein OPV22_011693 [Ensete ventricosum]|uniref:START domain-containing protein n=1 Tax=Ensete ventricosum TaxID=4639 RepID=A0AAV8RK88_ENSVE|nr:hypothetical protein OPV22_011693 [Ensete ventricosum]